VHDTDASIFPVLALLFLEGPMALTQANLDSVDAAILALSTGQRVASVQFGDRSVSYTGAGLPELLKLRDTIAASIPSTTRPKQFHAYHNGKGL